jgi:hypothetical protein
LVQYKLQLFLKKIKIALFQKDLALKPAIEDQDTSKAKKKTHSLEYQPAHPQYQLALCIHFVWYRVGYAAKGHRFVCLLESGGGEGAIYRYLEDGSVVRHLVHMEGEECMNF